MSIVALKGTVEPLDFSPVAGLDLYFKLVLAAFLGALVGFEREHVGKAAGVRTYSLVSMGSALFTILSIWGFQEFGGSLDPSRIAGQIVVGIGFIGAGIIMHQGIKVKGLTTAAALWTVAATGISVGVGFYWLAIFTAFLVFFILYVLGKLEWLRG